MRAIAAAFALVLSLLLLFGCPQQAQPQQGAAAASNNSGGQPEVSQPGVQPAQPDAQPEVPQDERFLPPPPPGIDVHKELQARRGRVNLKNVTGSGLVVASYWDPGTPVKKDGNFSVTVSALTAMKVVVKDSKNDLRAMAISLPEYPVFLNIDSYSTAQAAIYDAGAANQSVAQKRLDEIGRLPCFAGFSDYVNQNLPLYGMDNLSTMYRYQEWVALCTQQLNSTYPMN
jgi:hypothetical protein